MVGCSTCTTSVLPGLWEQVWEGGRLEPGFRVEGRHFNWKLYAALSFHFRCRKRGVQADVGQGQGQGLEGGVSANHDRHDSCMRTWMTLMGG